MTETTSRQHWRLAVGGVLLTLLLAAVFTMGSLDVPFEPRTWRAVVALYAVSSFITAALLIFGLILARSIVRLWAERSKDQLGARFKTKMVLGAMAISLLPVIFMFFVSYSLLNRTLGRWFPRPLEIASEETQTLLNNFGHSTLLRLRTLAFQADLNSNASTNDFLQRAFALGLDGIWIFDSDGKFVRGGVVCDSQQENRTTGICTQSGIPAQPVQALRSGVEIWRAMDRDYLAARVYTAPGNAKSGFILAGYRAGPDFLKHFTEIQRQTREYGIEKQNLRTLKRQMLLILFFFTLLVLFAAMWVALFLAKQVTVPIQALAEGTREVSMGNFSYQVPEQAHDELGVLVRAFNVMTTQLRDSGAQIDQFTRNLQQAVQELERRRQLMETVLENIPTGVVSLDASGTILRTNMSVHRMFRQDLRAVTSVDDLLGFEAARVVQYLMRRSLRMGVVSREIEVVIAGRLLHLAVTVSSLGPRRANTGFVLVFDDLTEMLRAQKSAAWQEAARRIAHEIKNPLTPIQLSAQRLLRYLDNRSTRAGADPELEPLVRECSRLIEREVATLAALVNEFSEFVRFPSAKLMPADVNVAVTEALELFSGRLEGITLKTKLSEHLPSVRADLPLLRSVVVNLIDNAAEAMEHSSFREIRIATFALNDSDTVAISVEDTGQGISPQDKDKLFLPHFSTKERGTGLGLAIAARIVAEHGGSIRVEDNYPVGSRFLIELPVGEPVTPVGAEKHDTETR
ncbi:MAG TPA: ATP-binding protein [Candidatus Dormibacteraeota bacterium]|nr:ATP-binding protein [Candidatus Dormibacteraeota bacterium]